MLILLMNLKMLAQRIDVLCQHRNLDIGRAGVLVVEPVLADQLLLYFLQ
jgi:hypothetical protein